MTKLSNNNSPGNDGITKKLYGTVWGELKIPLLVIINKAFSKVGEVRTSQKQALIKLKIKDLSKNRRPISLLSVDTKLVSKGLAECLKNVLPSLISPNQTAYVNGVFINGGRSFITNL